MDARARGLGSLTDSLVHATGVVCRFPSGRTGIEGVDLEVRPGDIIALIGPNGSGKTTLLRVLLRDLRPLAGSVAVRAGLRTGWAPDQAAHFDELTGLANARFFARANGAGPENVQTLLHDFGMADDANVRVSDYSFGMRRKLALVEAMAHGPDLLLLDEPTVGLDPAATCALAAQLKAQALQGGAVLGTNDLSAAALATRIVFLHRGRKIADATPVELMQTVAGTTRIEVSLESVPQGQPVFPSDVRAVRTERGFVFETAGGSAALIELLSRLSAAGARVRDVHVREPGLADAFRKLVGEELDVRSPAALEDSVGPSQTPAANRSRKRRPPWRRRK